MKQPLPNGKLRHILLVRKFPPPNGTGEARPLFSNVGDLTSGTHHHVKWRSDYTRQSIEAMLEGYIRKKDFLTGIKEAAATRLVSVPQLETVLSEIETAFGEDLTARHLLVAEAKARRAAGPPDLREAKRRVVEDILRREIHSDGLIRRMMTKHPGPREQEALQQLAAAAKTFQNALRAYGKRANIVGSDIREIGFAVCTEGQSEPDGFVSALITLAFDKPEP